jgi:iron complex outermembrane receptor protein
MRFFFFSILIFICHSSFASFGGNTIVSGRVVDEEKKPVEFAVTTLLKAEDSTLVKGALTAADGNFSFEGIPAGNYIVRISLTNYDTKWHDPFVVQEGETINLHDITLSVSKVLDEVAIVSIQPLFVQKPGMLIMNVENSPVRISGTAYDVVSKAPGVTVDQDGNMSLQGKGGVKIYVDGKPTYLSGDQLRNYLMLMPATDVVRVEIMTNPPAKYDAEGSAGIINIVTKKGTQQGLNGSVSAGVGYGFALRSETGISLNFGQPKYNLYSKYDWAAPAQKEVKFVTRTVHYNGMNTRYDQDVLINLSPITQHGRIGVDFFPSQKISWGLRCDGSSYKVNTVLDTRNTITQVESGNAFVLHQINFLHGRFENASAGAYYTQTFDTAGTELSASFDYVSYYNRMHENYNLHFFDQNGMENSTPVFQRTKKGTDIGIYVAQLDFSHPFSKKYKMEAGIKTSYVKTSNDLLFEIENTNSGNWANDTTRSNSFIYTEQINAAYFDCSADYGKWQLEAGLRAEQTLSDGNSPTTNEVHRNNYIQLFPTLFITQKISDKHSFQYSFARRINRPAYDELNPFIFYVDQYTYHIGNPFLQPEISNSVDITHDYGDFLFTSVGISRTTGGIAQITHQIDSTGILNQSSVNLNTIDNCYLNISFSKPIAKWWIHESNVLFSYNHYKTNYYGEPLDKSNVALDLFLTETFILKKGWKTELSAWYQSPMVYTIFVIRPSGDVSIGVSKNFFKNKLRFTLNAGDLFYTNTQRVTVDFDNQHLSARHAFDTRVVYVRLRYNFGNSSAAKKSQFKNAADDLQKRAKN